MAVPRLKAFLLLLRGLNPDADGRCPGARNNQISFLFIQITKKDLVLIKVGVQNYLPDCSLF